MDMTSNSGKTTADEISRYESYLKADPENTNLWITLGDLYHQSGSFDEAIACYEKCQLLDENNLVCRSRLANVMISQHRFAEAEQNLIGVLEKTGEDVALLHNLALSQFYQLRFEEAQQAFLKARELGLSAPKNLAYLIYSLHNHGDTDAAMELSKTWLQEAPGPATEGYVSMLEMDHGDMDAARQRAEQVIQQQPNNPDASVVLGTWNMEQQEDTQAADYFKRVIDAEPDNPRGWQGLGLVYMYQQNLDEAFKALEQARTLIPDNATVHLIIGWAQLASQNAQAAERDFRRAVAADHNFGEAHGGLACALVFQNKLEEARIEIKKAMGLDPKGFGAVFAQSISMQLKGKGNQGVKMLAKLLEQKPLPRSKPIIEHIQDFVNKQGTVSTPVKKQAKPSETIKQESED